MFTNPGTDEESQAILNSLVPEGAEPGTPPEYGIKGEAGEAIDPALAAQQPAAAPVQQPATEPAAAPSPAAQAPTPQADQGLQQQPAATPAPTSAPAQPEPKGDLRNALRAARRNERRLHDELERTKAELERVKQGGASQVDPLAMSEEELAEIAQDSPLLAETVRTTRRLQAELQQLRQAPAGEPEWTPPVFHPRVQEVIDEVPTLLAWQTSRDSQHLFDMATQQDESLRNDPLWRSRSPKERFEEAVRRTQAATQAAQAPAAPAPAPTSRQDPAAVIAAAPTATPAGISDFRGGAPASAPALDFSRMSDEDILSSLPVQP